MNDKTRTGLEILQAAVLLGILGDVLLRQTPWGLNVLLFSAALAAAMTMLVLRRKPEFWDINRVALHGAFVFFGAMFVWRDSIELKVFDTLAMLTILAVLILPALKVTTHLAGVFHYAIAFVSSALSATIGPLLLLFSDVEWKTIPQTGWSKHLFSVLRGILVSVPLILIFGALFVAADAAFESVVERTLNIDAEKIFGHVFLTCVITWITAGYLRGSLIETFARDAGVREASDALEGQDTKTAVASVTEMKDEDRNAEEKPKNEKRQLTFADFDSSFLPSSFRLGAVETSVILGSLNLLFLTFVIVQIPYLFGGMELVQNTPDFKLAEYARRGFEELVLVAALVLPLLLAADWLLRKETPATETIFKILAGIQIILLFVIMLSAAQRLFLLTGNLGYGLTTVRFYPMVFMLWLAIVFVWFTLTVLRDSRKQFAWGALWSAFVILGVLHAVNPDDYIVRTNIRLMQEGREFDAYYNAELSNDAVPALIEALPQLNCEAKNILTGRLNRLALDSDIRSWNYSRTSARNLLTQNADNLWPHGCPATTSEVSVVPYDRPAN